MLMVFPLQGNPGVGAGEQVRVPAVTGHGELHLEPYADHLYGLLVVY
jgi:hypothetical protein